MKRKNGFTLIELLAIIILLAIIVLLVVPAVGEILRKSREKAAVDSASAYIVGFQDTYTINILEVDKVTSILKSGTNEVSEDLNKLISVRFPPTKGYLIVGDTGINKDKVEYAEFCIRSFHIEYDIRVESTDIKRNPMVTEDTAEYCK